MFWSKKVACEHCGKKAKAKDAIYTRGSQFCSAACRDAWTAANPPPIARGEKGKLEQDLALVIDAALDEYSKAFGVPRSRVGISVGIGVSAELGVRGVVGAIDNINAQHEAELRQTALMTFQTHLLRCPPLLRALGHETTAMRIEEIDFMATIEAGKVGERIFPVTQTLEQIRGQLP